MSRTSAEELERDVIRGQKTEFEKLQEQYANGEISEQEFEKQVGELLESGDEFLDYEETAADTARDTGRSLKKRLSYYSLPLLLLASILAPIVVPGVSPMLSIVAAPTLLLVGLTVWIVAKLW